MKLLLKKGMFLMSFISVFAAGAYLASETVVQKEFAPQQKAMSSWETVPPLAEEEVQVILDDDQIEALLMLEEAMQFEDAEAMAMFEDFSEANFREYERDHGAPQEI